MLYWWTVRCKPCNVRRKRFRKTFLQFCWGSLVLGSWKCYWLFLFVSSMSCTVIGLLFSIRVTIRFIHYVGQCFSIYSWAFTQGSFCCSKWLVIGSNLAIALGSRRTLVRASQKHIHSTFSFLFSLPVEGALVIIISVSPWFFLLDDLDFSLWCPNATLCRLRPILQCWESAEILIYLVQGIS